MTPGVSVIIPTYEEAASIERVLEDVTRSLEKLRYPGEVIVVDDDSPDGTAERAESASRTNPFPIRVLRRRGPRSLSLSVIDGARAARYDVVAILDADLSHDPGDLPRVVEPVLAGKADVSVGSRYAPGGEISRWPLRRRVLSALGTRLARSLARVRDPLSGFFACRRELVDGTALELRPRGYKILFEILARSRGLRIAEVPIRFRDRRQGVSKFGLRQGIEFLRQLVSLLSFQVKSTFRGTAAVVSTLRGSRATIGNRFFGDATMKLKIAVIVLLVAAAFFLVLHVKRRAVAPEALGQAQGPEILLYTGENFTGRVLSVQGKVLDLPKDPEPDGSFFDWNDQVRSLAVVRGTWRLYQNGRHNTLLDGTPLQTFDIRTKPVVDGWSTLVSGTTTGPLLIPDLSAGGIGEDISSVELISETNLPDWALAFRKP